MTGPLLVRGGGVTVGARIAEIAAGDEPVYGINTGFGKLASIKIAPADVATLQRNLILSHCCGVGKPLSENIVPVSSGKSTSSFCSQCSKSLLTACPQLIFSHCTSNGWFAQRL